LKTQQYTPHRMLSLEGQMSCLHQRPGEFLLQMINDGASQNLSGAGGECYSTWHKCSAAMNASLRRLFQGPHELRHIPECLTHHLQTFYHYSYIVSLCNNCSRRY